MKYKVKVIETLVQVVEVEADSQEEATEKAESMWFAGDIDFSDIENHEFYLINQ